jgi:hypothetical protein
LTLYLWAGTGIKFHKKNFCAVSLYGVKLTRPKLKIAYFYVILQSVAKTPVKLVHIRRRVNNLFLASFSETE